jgi:periplasmic protein TonB
MKKLYSLLVSLIIATTLGAQVIDAPEKPTTDTAGVILTVVDEMPQFPGGESALLKFLGKNIKYPTVARDCGCDGTVFLSFIVNTDGSISNINYLRRLKGCETTRTDEDGKQTRYRVVKGPCSESGEIMEEAARKVVEAMPNWVPGKQNGKLVRVQYNLPVKFTLR